MLLAKPVPEEALRGSAVLTRGQTTLHHLILPVHHHTFAMQRNNYDFFIVFEFFFVSGEAAVFVVAASLRGENH